MNCPYCSNAVPEGATFCGNCGAKLDTPAPATEATSSLSPSMEVPAEPTPVASVEQPPAPSFAPGYTAPAPAPAKKSNKTLIIVIVLVLLLLCCCCALIFGVMSFSPVITDLLTQTQGSLR